jgi:hypothetical protein
VPLSLIYAPYLADRNQGDGVLSQLQHFSRTEYKQQARCASHGLQISLNELNRALAIFSLYLTPESVADAELTLGGIDESKFTGELRYSPIVAPDEIPGQWSLNSSSISVNGKTAPILNDQVQILFDSGTSNCIFPQNITEVSPSITD